MATLAIKRVGDNLYVAVVSGCVVGDSYTLQFRVVLIPTEDWRVGIAGLIPDGTGKITTWNWNLINQDYPTSFRVVNDRTGEVSNTVTIDPKNPPPIGELVGDGFNLLALIVIAVVVFLFVAFFVWRRK